MKFAPLALVVACGAIAATPTFNQDIAPILYENCANCHRLGEVAPFSLLSYSDAAKRASQIAAVTAKRYMPPWKAEAGYGHFEDERRLSDAQIAMIGEWARNGAAEGDPARKPAPPQFTSGWQSGKPDAVFTVPASFSIPADGRDAFQCFVVPLKFSADKYVKTVEFHPGNTKVVHHALFFLDGSGQARQLDAATPEPGYPCFGGPQIAPEGALGGWAPGATTRPLPTGIVQTVNRGSDLVIQIHYHPSGKPEADQSSIGLTFGDPPTKGLSGMIVGTRKIDLAAGAQQTITDWARVPEDVDLIGITPHAHLLCKEMKVTAKFPDGRIEPLIWIRDWDFNWQGSYRYAEPVRLPKGTRIEMSYVYDNSAGNPHNPSNPPKRVTFGEQTTDEMALLFMQVVLPRADDVPRFRKQFFLGRLEQILLEGGEPAGVTRRAREILRVAGPRFDANHDGKLGPEERTALLRFLAERIKCGVDR
ncbi:MAG: ascorbate-dependent monooxygenase [Acidobacteriia bacterium]|nr:ascorbate-dependent monooxygenase [Terriglobia bacterium]